MTSLSHSLRDALGGHARAGRTAFVSDDTTVTYREVRELVDAYAADAHEAGVGRGELVGVAGGK